MIINGSTLGSMGEMKDPNVFLIMPIYPFPWTKLEQFHMTLTIKEPYSFKHETSERIFKIQFLTNVEGKSRDLYNY